MTFDLDLDLEDVLLAALSWWWSWWRCQISLTKRDPWKSPIPGSTVCCKSSSTRCDSTTSRTNLSLRGPQNCILGYPSPQNTHLLSFSIMVTEKFKDRFEIHPHKIQIFYFFLLKVTKKIKIKGNNYFLNSKNRFEIDPHKILRSGALSLNSFLIFNLNDFSIPQNS